MLPKVNLHIYPSPDRISTERGSKTNRAAVVPELYLLLSVSYTIIPPLLVPALSLLGASHLMLSVLSVQRALLGALDRLLCLLGGVCS